MRATNAFVIILAAIGCASNPDPVPLVASAGTVSRLAGEWRGSFEGDQTGRAGSIIFRIEAGSDTAHGDVLMVPTQMNAPQRSAYEMPAPAMEPALLRVRFVQASAEVVRGEIAEYRDPQCGCRLRTTFEGTVHGDEISGTFTSVHLETALRQVGRWRVTRAR
jgi:hypothetical protein